MVGRAVRAFTVVLAVGIAPRSAVADAADATVSPEQVKSMWHGHLDRTKFTAKVHLEMELGGQREERDLLIWRADEGHSSERVMLRFVAPPTLHNMGVLFIQQIGRPSDYFLYQPEAKRIRRLPETVANEDVYGIDLEFIGFGAAQSEPTEVEKMTSEVVAGRPAYRLEERALRENPRFDERTVWIDARSFVPLKMQQRLHGHERMDAWTVRLEEVQGISTPMEIEFDGSRGASKVRMTMTGVDYRSPIPDEYFSTLALVKSTLPTGPSHDELR